MSFVSTMTPFTLNSRGKLFAYEQPVVMGILNINADSFYRGSRVMEEQAVLDRAGQMIAQGASMLDIGGQSTRPGATLIAASEELDRVLPAIKILVKHFPHTCFSIDTFYSEVAREAVKEGVHLVNDISAGEDDEKMLEFVAQNHLPFIAMHKKGNPQTMQQNPHYENVVLELLDYFKNKTEQLKNLGIEDWILDPGFGFGKNAAHNFKLLQQLSVFKIIGKPILAGISRKGMIWKTLEITPEQALNGTTALNMAALINGASVLRVHDVKEAAETVKLYLSLSQV